MKPLVLYHYPCLDGFTAAWACWLQHPDWEYRGVTHGQPPPDVRDREVYMLDFSYKFGVMCELAAVAKFIVVLDHHKSAEAELAPFSDGITLTPGSVSTVFDMDRSGAHLAWDYFNTSVDMPKIVAYVEDRDLWRFALPWTKEINAELFSHEYAFHIWNALADEMESGIGNVVERGRSILRKQNKDIAELVEVTKQTMKIFGHSVPCANLPYTLASDACHLMLEQNPDAPFAATYFDKPGVRVFGLRSREGGMDVSEIAKLGGGGGHKHAAGFQMPLEATV